MRSWCMTVTLALGSVLVGISSPMGVDNINFSFFDYLFKKRYGLIIKRNFSIVEWSKN